MSHSYFSLIAPACMMLLSLVFFASYRLVSRRPYLKLIGLAYLFSAVPMAIQSLSDNSGLASNSSLSAIFYLWGIWLFAKGFTLRSQVETWPKIAFIFGATTVGLLTYFSLVDDQLWLRTVIINLGLASISLLGIKGCSVKAAAMIHYIHGSVWLTSPCDSYPVCRADSDGEFRAGGI